MDKSTGKGYRPNDKRTETIDLALDRERSATLVIILKSFIQTSDLRIQAIKDDSDLSDSDRLEAMEIEESLLASAVELYEETSQILVELDEEPKPVIFVKPEWSKE